MKLFSMSLFSFALMAPAAALACHHSGTTTTAEYKKAGKKTCGPSTTAAKAGTCTDGVKQISVGQLAALQKIDEHPVMGPVMVFDANRDSTRAEYGMVPGAKALSSYKDYQVDEELPENKNAMLVFYCANAKCSAAPKAAQRAWDAGYTNVYVMHEGIMGWAEAGHPVERPSV